VTRHATPPEACFVAAVAMIVEDVADYRFHRVVVAGIRKFDLESGAASGDCTPRNAAVPAVMRHAIDKALDSINLKPPTVRANVELHHTSLEVVQSEIARIAVRAREHAGDFVRVEVVPLDASALVGSEEVALPRLAKDDADATACASDNLRLARAGATRRWAC
jgi:hypothetical protein